MSLVFMYDVQYSGEYCVCTCSCVVCCCVVIKSTRIPGRLGTHSIRINLKDNTSNCADRKTVLRCYHFFFLLSRQKKKKKMLFRERRERKQDWKKNKIYCLRNTVIS